MAYERTGQPAGEHAAGTDTPIYDDVVRSVAGFTRPAAAAGEPNEAPEGGHNARRDRSGSHSR
jgi:hypothetical protein